MSGRLFDDPDVAQRLGLSQTQPRVLVVDDDPKNLQAGTEVFRREGFLVEEAESTEEALRKTRRMPFDVIVIDLDMLAMDRLLDQVRRFDPGLPVLVCAKSSDSSAASEAIRQGAYDYVTKPLEVSSLLIRVGKALEHHRLTEMVRALDKQVHGRDRCGELVGGSAAMRSIYWKIEQAAPSQGAVLVLGERGTGKELVAREIHRLSPLRDDPFEAVRCGDEGRAERSPERHARDMDRATGVFRWASFLDSRRRGTVFLDKVDRLPPKDQALIANILDMWKARRGVAEPGAGTSLRLICSTATDLDQAIEKGTFLGDLYCHLSDFAIRVPALRERAEDTQLLAAHMLAAECVRLGRRPMRLSPRSLELLAGYDWPGNVSELHAVLKVAVGAASRTVIRPKDLVGISSLGTGNGRTSTLEKLERDQIEEALKKTSGNKSRAARMLGIGRGTIYRKLDRINASRQRP